jgi:hypothetical protein
MNGGTDCEQTESRRVGLVRIDWFCIIGKMAGFLSKAYMGRALGALGYPLQEFWNKSIENGLTFTLEYKIVCVLFPCVRLP